MKVESPRRDHAELAERHLSRFAIPGLIRIVVILNALVFLLVALNPEYVRVLMLDRNAILRGTGLAPVKLDFDSEHP